MKKQNSPKGNKIDSKKKASQMIIDSHNHWTAESFVRNVEKVFLKEDSENARNLWKT